MGVSKNIGVSPQIIHFNRGFHEINHPFWGYPYFWKHPYVNMVTPWCFSCKILIGFFDLKYHPPHLQLQILTHHFLGLLNGLKDQKKKMEKKIVIAITLKFRSKNRGFAWICPIYIYLPIPGSLTSSIQSLRGRFMIINKSSSHAVSIIKPAMVSCYERSEKPTKAFKGTLNLLQSASFYIPLQRPCVFFQELKSLGCQSTEKNRSKTNSSGKLVN